MKFSEKYELLESLTTGAVETFVANDRVRGERVLVHIVECAPQKPEQTTAEWALESFRRLAPEPPGPVLETGKYSGAKYAYVVTKPADESVVKAWTRQYELHAEDTKETKVQAVKKDIGAPVVTPPLAPAITAKEPSAPGQMTQLFRDFDSLAKAKASEPAAVPPRIPVRPAPSTSLPGGSGVHAADPWDLSSMKTASPPKEPSFTVSPAPPKAVAPELPPPGARDNAKPGEFTSFFQGPFRGDGPSDMPAYSSQPVEPLKKNVGEFTALFGGATPPKSTPAPPGATGPSFTGLFKDFENPQPAHNAPAPPPGGVMPPSVQPLPTVPPMNAAPLPDPVFAASPPAPVAIPTLPTPTIPPSPSGPAERPLAQRPSSLSGDGATGAFRPPTAEPTPIPVEAPIGPSPYTQIISRSKLDAPEESEAGQAPAASAGGGKFAPPAMPKIPGAAPPPMPKIPPAPKFAPPPMPKVKAPPAPKAPKIDAPAPPPVSLWPLIITLTVLFFLAVILVLYFALRR